MIGDLGQHSKAHQILPIEIPMRPPSPIIIMFITIMIIMVLIFANGKTIGSWLHWGGIAQKIWLCHPFLGPVPAKIITITSIIITIIVIIIVVVIIIIIIIVYIINIIIIIIVYIIIIIIMCLNGSRISKSITSGIITASSASGYEMMINVTEKGD